MKETRHLAAVYFNISLKYSHCTHIILGAIKSIEEMVNGLRLSLQLYLRSSLALNMGWLDWLPACYVSSKVFSLL